MGLAPSLAMKHACRRFWVAGLAFLIPGLAAIPAGAGEPATVCRELTAEAARTHQIPPELLTAVSLAESGRYDRARKAVLAWPWTIYAEGRGRYLDSQAAAVAEVKRLRARGIRNIDVGCMQVNLGHHPEAFGSIEQAFEPRANIDYAARFLKDLHERTRSWNQAVALYHSSTEALNRPYRQKVMQLWGGEIRRAAEERRREAMAAWAARRAALADKRAALDFAPQSLARN